MLFYAPFRFARFYASLFQILIMLVIMASGNFNFFNILTTALGVCILDDELLARFGILKSVQIDEVKPEPPKENEKTKKKRRKKRNFDWPQFISQTLSTVSSPMRS